MCKYIHLITKQEVIYADIGPNPELTGQESLHTLTENKVEDAKLKFQTKSQGKRTLESGEILFLNL